MPCYGPFQAKLLLHFYSAVARECASCQDDRVSVIAIFFGCSNHFQNATTLCCAAPTSHARQSRKAIGPRSATKETRTGSERASHEKLEFLALTKVDKMLRLCKKGAQRELQSEPNPDQWKGKEATYHGSHNSRSFSLRQNAKSGRTSDPSAS